MKKSSHKSSVRLILLELVELDDSSLISSGVKILNKFLKTKNFPYANSIKACAGSNYPAAMIKRGMAEGDNIGINAAPVFLIYQNGQYQEKVQGYYGPGYWENMISLLSN